MVFSLSAATFSGEILAMIDPRNVPSQNVASPCLETA